jgi:hypothetical protein
MSLNQNSTQQTKSRWSQLSYTEKRDIQEKRHRAAFLKNLMRIDMPQIMSDQSLNVEQLCEKLEQIKIS